MAGRRKTPQTWINAGLRAVVKSGPDGLRAETLARDLDATKGSFYWHFKDVPAFHDAVLVQWDGDIRKRFHSALDSGDTTVTRLRGLSRFKASRLDTAIRAWAAHDTRPRKVVSRVDTDMTEEIGTLLTDLEATHPDFPALVHGALIAGPKSSSRVETLIDLLLVLK